MKILRDIAVLLLIVALPWAATANMLGDLQCHHDGLGSIAPAQDAPAHHHAQGTTRDHGATAQATADQGCDCDIKCQCQHHCAGGCGAALALDTRGIDVGGPGTPVMTPYRAWSSEPQLRSLLRPPITAPPGAA